MTIRLQDLTVSDSFLFLFFTQRGSQFDNLSEEIEFNRLTSDENNENDGDTSAPPDPPKSFKFSKLSKSDMQLLQDLAAHQSID